MDEATDSTDDAREALETASNPFEGERKGDDGSSLCSRPHPRPGDFLPALFGIFLDMTVILIQ